MEDNNEDEISIHSDLDQRNENEYLATVVASGTGSLSGMIMYDEYISGSYVLQKCDAPIFLPLSISR